MGSVGPLSQHLNVSNRPRGDIGFSTKPTFDTKANPHLPDDLIDQVGGSYIFIHRMYLEYFAELNNGDL